MILAVEVNNKEWDFFCTDKSELDTASEFIGEELKIHLERYSPSSFRTFSVDISLIKEALSEIGIDLFYENENETLALFENYTGNSLHKPAACSEKLLEEYST
jgi:hypothetical protein